MWTYARVQQPHSNNSKYKKQCFLQLFVEKSPVKNNQAYVCRIINGKRRFLFKTASFHRLPPRFAQSYLLFAGYASHGKYIRCRL